MQKTGIILSGGGARGAYQAGCLKAIAEILEVKKSPFSVFSGISAGSLNAAYLAAYADQFDEYSKNLCKLWSNIRTEDVVETGSFSVAKIALHWVLDLGLGRFRSGKKINFLMNSDPLRNFLSKNIPLEKISRNIEEQVIQAFAITATNYASNRNITFVEQNTTYTPWRRVNRESRSTNLTVEHIMASAAIPVLFPPIKIDNAYYGDGALRNTAPLSSAIKLGAQKLVVIGVKSAEQEMTNNHILPTSGRQLSCLINSALLDGIEMDLERLEKINTLMTFSPDRSAEGLNTVDYVYLRPSKPISHIAKEYAYLLPSKFKHLISGLGRLEEAEEIISYLLFEGGYCKRLCQLGYEDTFSKSREILSLFSK